MALHGSKPTWLTFDCYGTLIQWDEGLLATVKTILARHSGSGVEPERLIEIYDRHEHDLERSEPHKSFREVAGTGLRKTMEDLGLRFEPSDVETLTSGISRMPPFPEVEDALAELKAAGFKLCIISNTDDDIIEGSVAQMGGHIDRVISAQQARAYKPSKRIFEFAYDAIGVTKDAVVHICASPHLDLAAARALGFRCIWINRGTGRKPLEDYTPDLEFPTLDRVPEHFRSMGWI